MKPLLPRDIPPYAAITTVALVLLASAVGGREEAPVAESAPPARQITRPIESPDGTNAAPSKGLELDKLQRTPKHGTVSDLLVTPKTTLIASAPVSVPTPSPAPRTDLPLPALADPPPPPAPARPIAPRVPFRYYGHVVDGNQVIAVLGRNNESLFVLQGQTIDGLYRVEEASDSTIVFTYLPLDEKQSVTITPPPR